MNLSSAHLRYRIHRLQVWSIERESHEYTPTRVEQSSTFTRVQQRYKVKYIYKYNLTSTKYTFTSSKYTLTSIHLKVRSTFTSIHLQVQSDKYIYKYTFTKVLGEADSHDLEFWTSMLVDAEKSLFSATGEPEIHSNIKSQGNDGDVQKCGNDRKVEILETTAKL